jgi:exopolysaccharide production protein ExoZ
MRWLSSQFELARGGRENERAMEGMRGFAVFLVFLVHFVTLSAPFISRDSDFLLFATAVHAIGNTGVDLFFVLSGYLIYGSLIARPQWFWHFLYKRVVRIYPTFLVVFAGYIVLSLALPTENKIPSPWTDGLIYLVQNILLLPGLFPIEPLITVAWSLSYEIFYYISIPLIIALFNLRARGRSFRVVFFVSVAALTFSYCATYGGHVRLTMFIAGILLYEGMQGEQQLCPPSVLGATALTIGLLSTILPIGGSAAIALKASIQFVGFALFCFVCFQSPTAWLARLFCWTPLRWLGNMSYSYYLLHGLALKAGFLALGAILPAQIHGSVLFWGLLGPMFVLTLIPTTALFLLVERPFSLQPRAKK